MSAADVGALIDNGSATGAQQTWPGGYGYFAVAGTFGGATVSLQLLGADGSTWTTVGSLTAAGGTAYHLPPGQIRALVAGGSPSGLYARFDTIRSNGSSLNPAILSDPTNNTAIAAAAELGTRKTRALYVEQYGRLFRVGQKLPGGIASYAYGGSDGGYLLTGTRITGGAGETSMVLNTGTVADLSGTWAAVVLHDDGTYGAYTVRNATGSALDVFPPLRSSCTRAPIYNLHETTLGQHLSKYGSYAYADHLVDYPAFMAERGEYYDQWLETAASGWDIVGGMSAGRVGYNGASNIDYVDAATKSTGYVLRRSKSLACAPASAGQGLSRTVTLSAAKSGYAEGWISSSSATLPVVAKVWFDSVLVYYNPNLFGMERICIPFDNVTTIKWEYTMTALDNAGMLIGGHTVWKRPADGFAKKLIPDRSRVVFFGDSWSIRHGGSVVERMNQRLGNNGCTVRAVGLGGQKASWGLANFDSLVAPIAPDVVVIEFGINDYNGSDSLATYKANIVAIVAKCAAIGAQPIVLMPPGTASIGQAQDLALWSATMAEGVAAP